MLSTLVCPGWLESHPECPARYFQHLYSWITFKCWTSRRQISRSAWGGLTCSSSVLKQKWRNCHLDSQSWLNKLAERLTGPKGSSSRGKSLTLFFYFFVFLCGLLGLIFVCLVVFGSLPQSPVGSRDRVTHCRGANLVLVHLPFPLPSPLSQGENCLCKKKKKRGFSS